MLRLSWMTFIMDYHLVSESSCLKFWYTWAHCQCCWSADLVLYLQINQYIYRSIYAGASDPMATATRIDDLSSHMNYLALTENGYSMSDRVGPSTVNDRGLKQLNSAHRDVWYHYEVQCDLFVSKNNCNCAWSWLSGLLQEGCSPSHN